MVLRCDVKGCRRNSSSDLEHSFFRLPKDAETRQKWLKFIGMDSERGHVRICTDHFEAGSIRKKYPRPLLVRNAVPTIRTLLEENPRRRVCEQKFAEDGHTQAQSPQGIELDRSSPVRTQIFNIHANNVSQIIISGEKRNVIVNIINNSKNLKKTRENVKRSTKKSNQNSKINRFTN